MSRSRDYEEKRDFFRMMADCKLSFKVAGTSKVMEGKCINLSAGGVLFLTRENLAEGSDIELNITPDKPIVPPLNAIVEVVRSSPTETAGEYEVAGTIKELL